MTLYLGDLEDLALKKCPEGMQRGRWLNFLAAQLTTWPESQWNALLANLAPRPERRAGKLTIAIRPSLEAELDRRRGQVSLSDVLRTALLRAGDVQYRPIPTVRPFSLSNSRAAGDPTIPAAASLVSARPPPPVRIVLPKRLDCAPYSEGAYWDFNPVDEPPTRGAKLRKMVDERKLNPDSCFPDLIPVAQIALAKHLVLAPVNRRLFLNLGITVEDSGDMILTGLTDHERTERVLWDIVERSDRPIRCGARRYRYGDAPEDVMLAVEIRTTSPPSRSAKHQWIEAFGAEALFDSLETVRQEERQRVLELEARYQALERTKVETEKTLDGIIRGLRKDLEKAHRHNAKLDARNKRAAGRIAQLEEEIEDLGGVPD